MGIESEYARDLVELLELPDREAAPALNARMLAIEQIESLRSRSFAERGLIAVEFQRRELYRYLGFQTFTEWIGSHFLGSRSSIYEAKALVEKLEPDVPHAVLANVSDRANLITLKQCSSSVRRSKDVQAAAQGNPDAFVSHLQANFPDQHIEENVLIRFFAAKSQAEAIEAGLQATMEAEGLSSRVAALEQWASEAITKHGVETG